MSGQTEFEKAGKDAANRGLVAEFFAFLKENKKWWLAPIILTLLVFGILIILAGTGAAPFIYSLF
ncbi:MAG: DUF5989 family protein [Verrucomicrobiota bacterium]